MDIHHPKIVLGKLVARFGSATVPLLGFQKVSGHSGAGGIAPAHAVLCGRIACLGRFAVPFKGFGNILRHALALVISASQLVLCFRQALHPRFVEPTERRLEVLRDP